MKGQTGAQDRRDDDLVIVRQRDFRLAQRRLDRTHRIVQPSSLIS